MTLEAGSLADDYHVYALEWEADQASLKRDAQWFLELFAAAMSLQAASRCHWLQFRQQPCCALLPVCPPPAIADALVPRQLQFLHSTPCKRQQRQPRLVDGWGGGGPILAL